MTAAAGSDNTERLRLLEDKMNHMEGQFLALTNSMPTNQTVIQKAKQFGGGSGARSSTSPTPKSKTTGGRVTSPLDDVSGGGGGGSGPILEIWQYTQINKRMDANEKSLLHLGSLLQDLIRDMDTLKREQKKNVGDINRIDDTVNSLLDRFSAFEKLKDSLVGFFSSLSLSLDLNGILILDLKILII